MHKNSAIAALMVASTLAGISPAAAQQNQCRQSTDIYFESGSSDLLANARSILAMLTAQAQACPEALVIVVAHIDSAEAKASPELGQMRAEIVAAVLREKLPNVPVLTQELGSSQPQRATGPDVREPLNRRVTVFIR